nr:class I SAM-dependent methyltransferase [candidate division Zixibacteria bacterium]
MFPRKPLTDHEHQFENPDEARHYAEHMGKWNMVYNDFLKVLERNGVSGRVLEVGAGPGLLAARVARRFPDVHVTAFEISSAMADYGREYMKKRGLQERVEYVMGDANDPGVFQNLPKFDLVYCSYSLHHFGDTEKSIKNLLQAVADGGKLCIFDFRRVWWLYIMPFKDGFFNSLRASYKPDEMKELLERLNITSFEIKKLFPFLLSVTIPKQQTSI